VVKNSYEAGAIYLLKLYLDEDLFGRGRPTPVRASVIREFPGKKDNTFELAMEFVELQNSTSEYLARYIFAEQLKQIKQQRLIEM
jgi:hypothetical protein